jgi:hypothetical protein
LLALPAADLPLLRLINLTLAQNINFPLVLVGARALGVLALGVSATPDSLALQLWNQINYGQDLLYGPSWWWYLLLERKHYV